MMQFDTISPIHSGPCVPMLQSFLAFLWSNSTFIYSTTEGRAVIARLCGISVSAILRYHSIRYRLVANEISQQQH